MKPLKEQIQEKLENLLSLKIENDFVKKGTAITVASEIESLINERFVEKEFSKWLKLNPLINNADAELIYWWFQTSTENSINVGKYIFDELYNYWLTQNNKQNDKESRKLENRTNTQLKYS